MDSKEDRTLLRKQRKEERRQRRVEKRKRKAEQLQTECSELEEQLNPNSKVPRIEEQTNTKSKSTKKEKRKHSNPKTTKTKDPRSPRPKPNDVEEQGTANSSNSQNEEETKTNPKISKIEDVVLPSTSDTPQNRKHGNTRKLSSNDWSTIEEGIKTFATSHDLSLKNPVRWMFPTFFNGERKRTGIWKYLACIVPGMSKSQIQGACTNRYLMPSLKTGPWTAEENETLASLVEEFGEQWAFIGRELNRFPNRVRSHWISTQRTAIGAWSCKEEEALIEGIIDVQQRPGKKELSQHMLDGIHWEGVAKLVGTRSAQQCMQKWYHSGSFHSQIEISVEWGKRDDQHLLRALFCSKARREEYVKWSALVPGRNETEIRCRWDELKQKGRIRKNLQKNVRRALQRELPFLFEKLQEFM